MKTSGKLLVRLRAEGADLPPCTELRRTNRNRRTGTGSWSWFAYCPLALREPEHSRHGNLHYGSHWPMRTLLAWPGPLAFQKLDSCGDICIDPGQESTS